jgi:hypothetical protein
MKCIEIVREMEYTEGRSFSRAYITKTLKTAMRKVYKNISSMYPDLTPYERISLLTTMFGIKTEKEYRDICFLMDKIIAKGDQLGDMELLPENEKNEYLKLSIIIRFRFIVRSCRGISSS